MHEHEEPVAIAEIHIGAHITWADSAHSPENTLWVPESLFAVLARGTLLGRIDMYRQTQLSASQCAALEQELRTVEISASDHEVRLAASLVRERARAVVESGDRTTLLVEGP